MGKLLQLCACDLPDLVLLYIIFQLLVCRENTYIEVLDSTRIHPETYVWARKMAVDALEIDEVRYILCMGLRDESLHIQKLHCKFLNMCDPLDVHVVANHPPFVLPLPP
jgi:hypothetical protein